MTGRLVRLTLCDADGCKVGEFGQPGPRWVTVAPTWPWDGPSPPTRHYCPAHAHIGDELNAARRRTLRPDLPTNSHTNSGGTP